MSSVIEAEYVKMKRTFIAHPSEVKHMRIHKMCDFNFIVFHFYANIKAAPGRNQTLLTTFSD